MCHWKKTVKALNANIEALQSSKSALDAQAQQTKLQIVREKTVQMGLAHDTVEQRAAASTSEAFAKEQAKVEGFACRNELKELSKEKEAAKKKSWKFGRMEAMANSGAFNLSTFGGVGRSVSESFESVLLFVVTSVSSLFTYLHLFVLHNSTLCSVTASRV
jgi:hypothetical protein